MIFIDTGAFIARYMKNDRFHQKAIKGWARLEKDKKKCCTSHFVLDETFTLLGRRAGNKFSAQRAKNIYASESLIILRVSQDDELGAIDLFEKYADQEFSFTDCTSMILMKSKRISNVFSFDHDFEKAGFQLWESSTD